MNKFGIIVFLGSEVYYLSKKLILKMKIFNK